MNDATTHAITAKILHHEARSSFYRDLLHNHKAGTIDQTPTVWRFGINRPLEGGDMWVQKVYPTPHEVVAAAIWGQEHSGVEFFKIMRGGPATGDCKSETF